jgi:hypothetical protein
LNPNWYVLDDNHEPVESDIDTWSEWRKNAPGAMRVCHSYYSYGNEQFIWVASDFLGLDHQWGEGPPLLFETMIFEYPPHDNKCWRCSTWAESQKQHARACLEVESWLIEQGYTFTIQVDEPAAYTEQRKVKRDASFAMLKKLREEMEKPKAAEEKP